VALFSKGEAGSLSGLSVASGQSAGRVCSGCGDCAVPTLKEERERLKWLIREGKINDETRIARIAIPSLDAKARIENREKKKQVRWNTDEQNYSEFAAVREAWMQELEQNPTLFGYAVVEAMRTFDVRTWYEDHATEQKG
jgi:hypothetical protein